jgi:hypothetical protein
MADQATFNHRRGVGGLDAGRLAFYRVVRALQPDASPETIMGQANSPLCCECPLWLDSALQGIELPI